MNHRQKEATLDVLLTMAFSLVLAVFLIKAFGHHLIFYPIVVVMSMVFLVWLNDEHENKEDEDAE